MGYRLGIDTGGTYTDAVILDHHDRIVTSAKALTTHADLIVGIREVMRAVLAAVDGPVELVGLSTTLATNAIVEGRGGRAALVLIGLGEELLARARLREAVGDAPVLTVAGGHDAFGHPLAPLDEEALLRQFAPLAEAVEAVAVVGQFAVREPAHERRAADLLRAQFGLPVTCSHELTSRIDAPRRALTTFLNARLLPEIDRLLAAVSELLVELAINAPLMIVRGDGSLISATTARTRPVETILSGPAASVVGALHLARLRDAVVVDVGGTTTDIATLERGEPRLAPCGARVAGYETMVEAIDLQTTGIGGDSETRRGPDGRLQIGPRRVVPLALLARQTPDIVNDLRAALERLPREGDAQFVVQVGRAKGPCDRSEQRLLALLENGPVPLAVVRDREVLGAALSRLEARGIVRRAGFTPTDAAHVLGRLTIGSTEAARLGAALEARRSLSSPSLDAEPVELFARQVLEAAERAMTAALLRAAVAHAGEPADWLEQAWRSPTLERALSPAAPPAGRPLVEMRFRFMRPLVGVGAPAPLLLPRPAVHLDTPLIIPPHHEVCNAIGAVAGEVVQRLEIIIGRDDSDRFLVHLPDGTRVVSDYGTARRIAQEAAEALVRERAQRAGAMDVAVAVKLEEQVVEVADGGRLLVEARVRATARGRPAVARR